MVPTVSSTPRGFLFGAYCKALAVSQGDALGAHAYAQGQGPAWAQVALALKGAIAPLETVGNALATPVAIDFAEYLRPQTLIGRMAGLHRVPFNTRLISVAVGAAASWVGAGAPKPVSKMDLDTGPTLPWNKITSLAVFTAELARSSAPGIELALTRDVAAAAAYAADVALVDPANAGTVGIKPASITSTVSPFVSSGSTLANIDGDLRKALGALNDSNVGLESAYWLLSPKTATFLSLMRGSGGTLAFPGVTAKGGTLAGLPCLTSAALITGDSPAESSIVLVAASEIMLADDGASRVETSEHATLEMDGVPAGGATQLVSLWQHNLVGLLAERVICWQPRRAGAVAVVTQVQF